MLVFGTSTQPGFKADAIWARPMLADGEGYAGESCRAGRIEGASSCVAPVGPARLASNRIVKTLQIRRAREPPAVRRLNGRGPGPRLEMP